MAANRLNELITSEDTDLTLELQFFEDKHLIGASTIDLAAMREESQDIHMQVMRNAASHILFK